jgi:quercetin dioxygenase-like cupin family protein
MTITTTAAPTVVPAAATRLGESRTHLFEGVDHGSSVSFFQVQSDPGQGPALHRHPYDETFSVVDGEVTFVVDGRPLVARSGDTAVVPAGAWHRFTNSGAATLRMVCIHASPVLIQEFAPAM